METQGDGYAVSGFEQVEAGGENQQRLVAAANIPTASWQRCKKPPCDAPNHISDRAPTRSKGSSWLGSCQGGIGRKSLDY